ncbi:hypothetical protein SBA3_3180035 [Candidatus Sulfopaludibacter sp. SbA3]|nr:hypothetical protein SBA3_3180035 [Candidatus Sulfopaludibacter sp. SbA3]
MPDTSSNRAESTNGSYSIRANKIEMITRPPIPPAIPDDSVITIWSAGTGTDGLVNARGSQGVRITAGPPPLPPTESSSTNGVEIMVGEAQNVTIQRGLIDGVDQKIVMAPGSITIDAGTGSITIQSLTQITLSVAGGLSTITLGPQGVTIKGILVQIN